MTWPACGVEGFALHPGRDGSFSLWSEAFGEGFHSGRGALREARETFLYPSQLERVPPGGRLRLVEVAVGTASNLALLLEACAAREIALEWWGLELDRRPLRLALSAKEFRRPWQPSTLLALEQAMERGSASGMALLLLELVAGVLAVLLGRFLAGGLARRRQRLPLRR